MRLDPETERALARLSHSTGRSRSEIIREAILDLARRSPLPANTASLYDTVADLVGVVRGGDRALSVRTGDKMRALLTARARNRRK